MWSFSSQQATLRRLNKAFAGFFRRVKAGQTPGYPRFKGKARFDSVEWPKDGDGARWLPEQRRVYLQGIGQVKVHLHRQVQGRVKTIQVKRQGRRWMLVLSCDDVPTKPLPATGAPGRYRRRDGDLTRRSHDGTASTIRGGARRPPPTGWRRRSSGCSALNAAPTTGSLAGRRWRRGIVRSPTSARTFTTNRPAVWSARYDLLVVEDLQIANMLRRAKPVPDPDNPGSSCQWCPGEVRAQQSHQRRWLGPVRLDSARQSGRRWAHLDRGRPPAHLRRL